MTGDNWTRVDNAFNWTTTLRPAAFRVYLYVASKPETWQMSESEVRAHCKGLGHQAYVRAIRELINAGLLGAEVQT